MKATLALTAMLGTAFGAFALPSVGGPVHFRLTRPFSMFATSSADNVTLGAAPLEFILTDIIISKRDGVSPNSFDMSAPVLLINGSPVLQMPWNVFAASGSNSSPRFGGHVTLSTGIFVPAGAVISVGGLEPQRPAGVHVSGYVQ